MKLGMTLFGLLPIEEVSSTIKVPGVLPATTSEQFFLNILRHGMIHEQFFSKYNPNKIPQTYTHRLPYTF